MAGTKIIVNATARFCEGFHARSGFQHEVVARDMPAPKSKL
jgi:hypothetical protein